MAAAWSGHLLPLYKTKPYDQGRVNMEVDAGQPEALTGKLSYMRLAAILE